MPPYIEKIMTGIYRSANVSNHDFRPPIGMAGQEPSSGGGTERKIRLPDHVRHQLQKNIASSVSLVSLANIDVPPEFSTLKAYDTGAVRAEKTAREFNEKYIVSRGSSYKREGPPIACCGDRKRIPHFEKGRLFVAATKDHSDAGRIANAHRAYPIMSMLSRDSPRSSSPSISLLRS